MKLLFLFLVFTFCVAVVIHEVWTYVSRDRRGDPFVSAGRMWRRIGGTVCLAGALAIVGFYEAVIERFPGLTMRFGLLAVAGAMLLAACYAALRDMTATARAALREEAKIQRGIVDHARRKHAQGAEKGEDEESER